MTEQGGYVKLFRKSTDWGWYGDPAVKVVFIHLLLTANFKETTYKGTTIKVGQTIIGLESLSKQLGVSVQQIRTAIKKLKSTGEITTEATNKGTLITVVNWGKYQGKEDKPTSKTTRKSTSKQQTTNKRATNEQQLYKNDKNIKNDKKYNSVLPDGFSSREEYEKHIADLRR